MTKITVSWLVKMKSSEQKIAALTAYDGSFATLLDNAGVEIILVGDSLGMVLHGGNNTLNVTMDDMIYHTRQVARKTRQAMIVVDMPYKSYEYPEQALSNAKRLVEAGADVVKLERGDKNICEIIRHISDYNIPVCSHLGLTPQSIRESGDYKVQGKDKDSAEQIKIDALATQSAGAVILVLEYVPASLAADITAKLQIPVIGIGAGGQCDGQVLVSYDMLGISEYQLKSSKNFLKGTSSIQDAVRSYIRAVKSGQFPSAQNQF